MKQLVQLICFSIALTFSVCTHSNKFIAISDIHFDPYYICHKELPCKEFDHLRNLPITKWDNYFRTFKVMIAHKHDTNNALFESALNEYAKANIENKPNFGILLGDLLAHDYKQKFMMFSSEKSQAAYQDFVYKTIHYITYRINQSMPGLDVYPALGNNDSYIDDYIVKPEGKLLKDLSKLWSTTLIKNPQAKKDFKKAFKKLGYYATEVDGIKLITLDTVIFTSYDKHGQYNEVAETQLKWFHNELAAAVTKKKPVMITMHIPAGIDLYKSAKQNPFSVIPFWKDEYIEQFHAELTHARSVVKGIFVGHTHMDWFQILHLANDTDVPVIAIPALSPQFNNNPGYKIISYQNDSKTLSNYQVNYLPISENINWRNEYDFNQTYQPDCVKCSITNGMNQLLEEGPLTELFLKYFTVNHNVFNPVIKLWKPYGWCLHNHIRREPYMSCVEKSLKSSGVKVD